MTYFTSRPRRLGILLTVASLSVSMGSSLSAAAVGTIRFAIPPSDLAQALRMYISESGEEVIFSSAAMSGVRSNGVFGRIPPDEALSRLLRHSGLEARRGQKNVWVVRSAPRIMPTLIAAAAPSKTSPEQPAQVRVSQGQAEESLPSTGAIGDIIVTAERSSKSLQESAITIQVLGSDQLAAAGVTTPEQLSSILPGVQIGTSGLATSVHIRGVGGFQSTIATSPAVPYYIDGIYVARTQSVVSEMYDIDRVEVVKGPQGTLYGRNASGGAINILTRNPQMGEFRVRGAVEIGNYGNQTGELAVNVPVTPRLAIRAAGTINDKGGFSSVGFGENKYVAGRAKILWRPSTDLSLLLNTSYGRVYGGQSSVVALNREIPGWYPWLDVTDPRAQAFIVATAAAPVPGFVRPSRPSDARQDLRFFNLSGQLEWTLGSATLTVLPAYRHARMQYTGLFGFLLSNGYSLGSFPNRPLTSKASSIEARLAGDVGKLHYVMGGYSDNEDQTEQFTINGGYLQTPGQITIFRTRSYAAFGQGTLGIFDQVRLIGGLRFTADRRAIVGQTYLVSPAAFRGPVPVAAAACAYPRPTATQCLVDSFAGRKTFRSLSWKGGMEADVLSNSLFYVTASRGFKAGAFNEQSAVGTPGAASLVEPEKLTSYEAGLKSRFLSGRLQVNLSAFYWDYKNHQEPSLTFTNVPGVTNLVFQNAGAAEIYGGTIDVIGRPWRGGTVSGSLEYAPSRYKTFNKTIPAFSYNPAATGCSIGSRSGASIILDCSAFPVSRAPKWAGNLGLNQETPLGRGTLVGDAALAFSSSRWLGTDFIPIEHVKGYAKLDLSLTYRAPHGRWSLQGFVRNVTNAAIYTEASKNPFSALVRANIQSPRTYGARFAFDL